MSVFKECPHCGHENLLRAMYCFQCGKALDTPDTEDDDSTVARRSQRIVQTMWPPENLPEASRDNLPGTAMLRSLHLEEPLTCLSCGALNRPNARFCTSCGIPMVVPDRESHLVARASARTDVGQVRENNEDSIGLWAMQGLFLALVADGMGGAVAGEEASRLTVEAVQADFVGSDRGGFELLTLAEEMVSEKLAKAIESANLAVIDRVYEDAALRGMGTTATLAFIRGRRAIVAHVGDSRAYLVDQEQGWINQITSDHSFVEALLAAGHITDEQAAEHPMRNVLYRALGQAPDTTADTYDRYLKDGDRIVLCSDGLTRHIDPEEIAEIVLADENPEVATQRLIDLANKRGGEDNISAVVILMELSADATTELEPVGAAAEVDWEEQADLPEDTDPEIPVPDAVPVEPSDTEATLTEAPSEREELLQMLAGAGGDDTIPVRPEALSDSPVVPLNDAETDVAESMFVQSKEASTGTTAESIPAADVRLALKLDAEDDLDDDDDVLSEADD